MGVTYKARDINLDSPVALKILRPRISARPEAQRRFQSEARAAARLRHPNVASVFHFGVNNLLPDESTAMCAEGADCFYAMEFVEGETLEARLSRKGPLTVKWALEIAIQVCRALAAAERLGLVHRDLKPSNIMLATEEESAFRDGLPRKVGDAWVKVIDFGVAQLGDQAAQAGKKFVGTLAFASPEQIRGEAVDMRSDLYSLGATLWYCLCGNIPFPGRLPQYTNPVPDQPLDNVQLMARKVPQSFLSLLHRLLASNPAKRPASAAEFVTVLEDYQSKISRPSTRLMPMLQRPFDRWALAISSLAAAAAMITLVAVIPSKQTRAQDRSIAVLPLQNLRGDPASSVFSEGLEDDIISRLVKIRDLKVITHLSSSNYPADAQRDLYGIGRSLGVRHVLCGSFDRVGNRISLHVSLRDTHDGHEIWSQKYDRTLADVITLQGELASSIATALNATLTPQETMDVRERSTGNPDAYALYLRGRKFDNRPTFAISDNEEAQALYAQAIALDPGFALAHARRGAVLAFLYCFRAPNEDLKVAAYSEVEQALRLRPELGEAHLAKASCLYHIDRDYDGALAELKTTQRLLPNDPETDSIAAYIYRRRGQWREARAALQRVLDRDPKNMTYAEELHTTGCFLRDWNFAAKYIRLAESIAPRTDLLKVERGLVDVRRDGNLLPLQQIFANLKSYGDPEGTLAWMRWDAAMLARDFASAQEALDGFPSETLPSVLSAPVPKSYLKGCIALASGDHESARQLFEIARPMMEAESLTHPESDVRHARLGLLYAYIGRRNEAIREGKRAVELKPISRDAIYGPEQLCNLALIYAWVGEKEKAISMIEGLLREPGAVFFYEASMSWWELRLRWQWDPLRDEPRFQKILAEPEPQTSY
jgi:non-specific serine/threonine protein kinase